VKRSIVIVVGSLFVLLSIPVFVGGLLILFTWTGLGTRLGGGAILVFQGALAYLELEVAKRAWRSPSGASRSSALLVVLFPIQLLITMAIFV
jgi:hypothetical protein